MASSTQLTGALQRIPASAVPFDKIPFDALKHPKVATAIVVGGVVLLSVWAKHHRQTRIEDEVIRISREGGPMQVEAQEALIERVKNPIDDSDALERFVANVRP